MFQKNLRFVLKRHLSKNTKKVWKSFRTKNGTPKVTQSHLAFPFPIFPLLIFTFLICCCALLSVILLNRDFETAEIGSFSTKFPLTKLLAASMVIMLASKGYIHCPNPTGKVVKLRQIHLQNHDPHQVSKGEKDS